MSDVKKIENTASYSNIVLVVTGGVAAYKSAVLVRLMMEQGFVVKVVMTKAATDFIAPLTFQALTGYPVGIDMLDGDDPAGMEHISLARWADYVVVAPASADFLARLRAGMANDLASAICLAVAAPIFVAPAMNHMMWLNQATQENIHTLRRRGIQILGPDVGFQACGDRGAGRMLEPAMILDELKRVARKRGALKGIRVMVTAGPTREPLDPVRFLTNRSSGKMGYAIAQALLDCGADVRLVSGPVNVPAVPGCNIIEVEQADEMLRAVKSHLDQTDIFIATAAVSDYRPKHVSNEKIKKENESLSLELVRNSDILSEVAKNQAVFTVGFAAETQEVEHYAKEKLVRKGLDMIAANCVSEKSIGFDSEDNELRVYWCDGKQHLPRAAKSLIAKQLVELITERFYEKNKN